MALDKGEVIERLLLAHEAYYNVTRDYGYAGRSFPGYAEFISHAEKYVLVKRAKLWEVDAFEYIFFDAVEHVGTQWLADSIKFMTQRAIQKVDPQPNHMSSYLSLVVVADSVDDDAKRMVRKTRFRKNFRLGIRGWADLRLAVVDLSCGTVVTNGQGKAMEPLLKANLDVAEGEAQDA